MNSKVLAQLYLMMFCLATVALPAGDNLKAICTHKAAVAGLECRGASGSKKNCKAMQTIEFHGCMAASVGKASGLSSLVPASTGATSQVLTATSNLTQQEAVRYPAAKSYPGAPAIGMTQPLRLNRDELLAALSSKKAGSGGIKKGLGVVAKLALGVI